MPKFKSKQLDTIFTALEQLIQDAFDAGQNLGRVETDNLKAKMADLISTKTLISPPSRAVQGTVKPQIIKIITDSGTVGMTTEEVIKLTGFKSNSIRGTLWALRNNGFVVKQAGRWFKASLYEPHVINM